MDLLPMAALFSHLHRLFPENGFRLAMNLHPLSAREYFQTRDVSGQVLALRRQLLEKSPEHYLVETELAAESLRLLSNFLGGKTRENHPRLAKLGGLWEPDVVLLEPDDAGKWTVVAGCVCFPTMWSLPEKVGKSLLAIHGLVPGLNAQIGANIDSFLDRLNGTTAFGRENWGLAATDQLDRHPRHGLPAIPACLRLEETWLRIEEQALVRLGERTILFAIRIQNHRLDEVVQDRELSRRLASSLQSMPEEMADYKQLRASRSALIDALT